MNGDLQELYNELSKEFRVLEVKHEERSGNHELRAKELGKKIDWMCKRIEELPCAHRGWIPKAVYGLYGWIGALTLGLLVYVLRG